MPHLRATAYVIAVPDLERSAAYYRDVLGFTIHSVGHPGWRFYQKDNCMVRAGHCPDALAPTALGDHAYFAYIEVEGIETYFAEVTARGAHILKPLRDEAWGMREFALQTVDGHRIMFGERYTEA